MFGFGQLIEILKKDPKKIVFTEGEDPRILEAASRLLASQLLTILSLSEIQRRLVQALRRAVSISVEQRL